MYLMKILLEYTDEDHDITLAQIEEKLKAYDVTAERKSLYDDIEHLRKYGFDIVGSQYDRTYHYQLLNREFELPELKILVDSVTASKFITEKKSKELIDKIAGFASKYQAEHLHRQVYVSGRIKSENESIYYFVDDIYNAIDNNCKITFQYFHYDSNKNKVLAHNGKIYHVSPWAMCWDDEKYYLIGYDEDENEKKIKHFRVDKIINLNVLEEKREGREQFGKVRMAQYTDRLFGMFDGEEKDVTLLCTNNLANVMIDRFGMDIPMIRVDSEHFKTVVKVAVSDLFLGWIMALGTVKIISPDSVVQKLKDKIENQSEMYR